MDDAPQKRTTFSPDCPSWTTFMMEGKRAGILETCLEIWGFSQ
jgi:hypothetical protein